MSTQYAHIWHNRYKLRSVFGSPLPPRARSRWQVCLPRTSVWLPTARSVWLLTATPCALAFWWVARRQKSVRGAGCVPRVDSDRLDCCCHVRGVLRVRALFRYPRRFYPRRFCLARREACSRARQERVAMLWWLGGERSQTTGVVGA
jgi:hypothetical protein